MGKVLDIAAYGNLSVAIGYDKIIYVWGFFYQNYYITTPIPTKFSSIHDAQYIENHAQITDCLYE